VTDTPRKPWNSFLELSFLIKQIADHSPELALTVLALPELAKAMPQPTVGTSLPGNRFYLGQRVRIVTDGLDLFSGRTYRARVGDLGTVTNVPTDTDPDYGVVLDNNPTGKRHAFSDDELAPLA
jgi:hypothetical protein